MVSIESFFFRKKLKIVGWETSQSAKGKNLMLTNILNIFWYLNQKNIAINVIDAYSAQFLNCKQYAKLFSRGAGEVNNNKKYLNKRWWKVMYKYK